VSLEGLETDELRQRDAAGKVRESTDRAQALARERSRKHRCQEKDEWIPGLDSN
jgi:hypothetical protein